MDYLKIACERLGIDASQVIKHRIEDDELVVIANLGIRGTPKYVLPLADLEIEEEPVEAPEPELIEINATPEALTMAEIYGIDLASIQGSGPGGRIYKRDVEAAL